MRSGTRLTLLSLVGVIAAPLARADAPISFAGPWSASPLTTSWSIGDWGDACGPKPTGTLERGGTVTIQQVGGDLVVSGLGRSYDTSSCWEPLPGLLRTSHSTGARTWRTTCKSPAGDPRQSSLVTSITALDDNTLAFDETGQYQFVIKGQNCTASARRSRAFRRIVAGAPAPTSAPTATQAAAPLPAASAPPPEESSKSEEGSKSVNAACRSPGPPARIEVRPSHKLMRPGDSFAFRAQVADARGCTLGIVPAFRFDNAPEGVSITSNGKVTVSDGAPDSEAQVVAAVGSRSVKAAVTVVSRERFDSMLAQGGFDPSGASKDAAVARFESAGVGARGTVLKDDSGRKRAIFVGVVGATALALGIVGLVLVGRSRRRSAAGKPEARPASGPTVASRPPTVCPTCRDEYPPETQFCPKDGNRVVPLERGTAVGPAGSVCPVCGQGYDPGVSVCPKHDEPLVPPAVFGRTMNTGETRKICPVCGAQYGGESQFCGTCGAALVPVN
ncbi:MAG TPA: hypothetical protein VNN72_14245 [Polyangiaceae bacterium]|nr:hypothetical protein [Polyangiaceae bacterium]